LTLAVLVINNHTELSMFPMCLPDFTEKVCRWSRQAFNLFFCCVVVGMYFGWQLLVRGLIWWCLGLL